VTKDRQVYDFAAVEHDIDRDLARRDFTINAMAIDLATGTLLDPHGGREDVRARVARMVRPENFDDDPLRTLKGVRMAVKYDLTIDDATAVAIRARAGTIADVAPERVTYELVETFKANAFRRAIALLRDLRFDEALGLRTRTFQADDVSVAGAFALLVRDPRAYAEKWRWSEQLLRDVLALQRLLRQHDRLALYDAGEEVASQLPAVLRALGQDDTLDWPDFTIRSLLTGEEIAGLTHLPPGRELGTIKRALLEAQVAGEVRGREEAERFVTTRGAS
jgi:hypothetical protein